MNCITTNYEYTNYMQTDPLVRVNKHMRCDVCGKADGCLLSASMTICMHVASDCPVTAGKGLGGWKHYHDKNNKGYLQERSTPAPATPRVARGEPNAMSQVYLDMLAECPLTGPHMRYLLGRKCQLPLIELCRYGSVPKDKQKVVSILQQSYDEKTLLGVPGFTKERNGRVKLNMWGTGILIPVQDCAGRVIGIQIRNDDSAYRWLTSRENSSGAPAHVYIPTPITDSRIIVVEGPKKAHVVGLRLGAVAIGITGVGNWKNALGHLERLQNDGSTDVVIALDEDAAAEQPRQQLAASLAEYGWNVNIARWSFDSGKGPDDLLINGGMWTTTPYAPKAPTPRFEPTPLTGKRYKPAVSLEKLMSDAGVILTNSNNKSFKSGTCPLCESQKLWVAAGKDKWGCNGCGIPKGDVQTFMEVLSYLTKLQSNKE